MKITYQNISYLMKTLKSWPPDFFPYGEGGYYSEQSTKLPIRKYFQQCLLNVDIHFAQNMEYLFCAQYISDI